MTQPTGALRGRTLVAFAIVTLVWSSTWLVIRDQVSSVPVSWSVTYRFLVAGVAMLGIALVRRESLRLDRTGWGLALAVGASHFCLNFNLLYRAEEHITSGIAAVIYALLLVPNAVLGRIFLGQRIAPARLIGMTIACAGLVLLFVHQARADHHGAASTWMGVGLCFGGLWFASVANVVQASQAARARPVVPLMAAAMLLGAALDALLAWAVSGPPVIELRPAYLGGILYLGLFGSALTFPLYFAVIRSIGPTKAAYSSVLIPVIAMLLSTLFEDYRWTSLAVFGSLLAGVGLVLELRARSPAR